MPHAQPTPLHLRVFLASSGDVADERALVRRLLKDELPYDPFPRIIHERHSVAAKVVEFQACKV